MSGPAQRHGTGHCLDCIHFDDIGSNGSGYCDIERGQVEEDSTCPSFTDRRLDARRA